MGKKKCKSCEELNKKIEDYKSLLEFNIEKMKKTKRAMKSLDGMIKTLVETQILSTQMAAVVKETSRLTKMHYENDVEEITNEGLECDSAIINQ